MHRIFWFYGPALIVIGLSIIFACLYTESEVIWMKLFEHFGMAMILVGLVGILLEFRDWKRYFQERIARTIIEKPFLNKLSRDELSALQTDTIKAFFKIDDLNKESFIDFFQSRLHDYLGGPYREDVTARIVIESADAETFKVQESFCYSCRSVGGCIQEDARWAYQTEEGLTDIEVTISLQIPYTVYRNAEFQKRYAHLSRNKSNVGVPAAIQRDKVHRLSLSEYKHVDGLQIAITARYKVPKNRMMSWVMTHPSKKVRLAIDYPKELTLHVDTFGIQEEEATVCHEPGRYVHKYDSWLLPDTGYAFNLYADAAPARAAPVAAAPAGTDLTGQDAVDDAGQQPAGPNQ